MKIEKNKTNDNAYLPSIPRSYSIDEILKAGGASAFANKLGKSPKELIAKLSHLPADAFLTDEELISALAVLNESK